ncbi:mitochondrial import inner membrane translocase subunit tim-16 [Naegleria gruberi]|uniref:Mitochondrial import inner membrane translocase subunit tim-16 n=1 Tax=Naegleria gruberi TaxID=5762 RepID=D2UX66_NAEGR|nr:mitochondrial import inner membrane translocase subunit tim-16 [Naegleria gruberi]EFC50573.1 mitochondrial import inner membrane translocase subunit tim-16 [Naegleria gruberi]|eukprot:XP_002683317.1 mitochondrial import inner membrane translocase subunit tim-16 [Naegleria gruberi strain NEG-M]
MAIQFLGVLVRAAVAVGSIAVGAFRDAYKQAAARGAAAGAAGANTGAFGQKLDVTKSQPMTMMEAQKILGLPKVAEGETVDYNLVQEKFDKMFKNNNPKTGGSFYIQSKIIRAKQFIEYELIKENKLTEEQRLTFEERTKNIVDQHSSEN